MRAGDEATEDLPAAERVREEALDGLSARFVALLRLPDGDPEVREIASALSAALLVARRTSGAELLGDALRFAQGRLVVRGLSRASVGGIGAALALAAQRALGDDERDRLDDLLARAVGATADAAPPEALVLGSRAREYVELVLGGDRKAALALTRRCVTEGMSLDEILLDILEPAQRDVGRRWALGQISIAQENFCTAVTQFVMTDLYPTLFSGEESRRRLVAIQVPGSRHHVGLRMVVDVLECRGWSTNYCVDDPTVEELPDLLAEDQADLLLVSASMPGQIPCVDALIRAVRHDLRTRDVKVVVGGRPFLVAPNLVEAVGADGWARDARSAVDVCDALVGGDRARR